MTPTRCGRGKLRIMAVKRGVVPRLFDVARSPSPAAFNGLAPATGCSRLRTWAEWQLCSLGSTLARSVPSVRLSAHRPFRPHNALALCDDDVAIARAAPGGKRGWKAEFWGVQFGSGHGRARVEQRGEETRRPTATVEAPVVYVTPLYACWPGDGGSSSTVVRRLCEERTEYRQADAAES